MAASHDPYLALSGQVYAYGFSLRKRPIVRRFLPETCIRFVGKGHAVPPGASLLLWGGTPLPAGVPADVKAVRIEDGFLRSVGLGADLVQPLSWVIDQRGIYFDATQPSDLEYLLNHAAFPAELLERAERLRLRIVESGLTKYNVGAGTWVRPSGASSVILVPGQVETDASIRLGAPGLRTNLQLLREVRRANPDAYLIYKPHPDVRAGLRAGGQDEMDAQHWVNEVVTDVVMGDLLTQVDEVHTLTSLAGFEALLRGRRVVCYGQPFYAGWGLTTDMLTMPRRGRQLRLAELVAAALILYPRYVSPEGLKITPELALDELLERREVARAVKLLSWQRAQRALLRIALWAGGKRR